MAKRKPFVRITREAYNAITEEATRSRRERVGVVYGRRERDGYRISKAERLSPEVTSQPKKLSLKHKITGVGGKLASKEVESYVKEHPGITGFYHSHPSGEPLLSPGDKKEFESMRKYDHLRRPSELQIITRMKGLGVTGKKGKPLFFVRGRDGKYRKAEVVVE